MAVKNNRPKRVTLKDIANHLGVATSTVSNAYNRPDQLSESLRNEILETAKSLGYSGPNPAARNLRKGVTYTIGLLFSPNLSYAFTDPVASLFIQGITRAIESAGYSLLLIGTRDPEPSHIPVNQSNVDGFIIHCYSKRNDLYQAAAERQLPCVIVDSEPFEDFPVVDVEDEQGAYLAAHHLIQLGHRKIGLISYSGIADIDFDFVGPPDSMTDLTHTARLRFKGYRRAIEEAGLSWAETAISFVCGENSIEAGAQAADQILSLDSPPTAILATSDQLAFGVMQSAAARSIAIPAELSVVGYDDTPASAYCHPPLTTIHQSHIEKGKKAGEFILAMLSGASMSGDFRLPTSLVVRESTAPPPERRN